MQPLVDLRNQGSYAFGSKMRAEFIMAKKAASEKKPERHLRIGIARIVTQARWYIHFVTGVIAVVFTVHTLRDVPFTEAAATLNHDYVQGFILSFYIWCWYVGTNLDVAIQSRVYLIDPQGGRARVNWIVTVGVIAVIALAIVMLRRHELWFAVFLLAFTTFDMVAWILLVRSLRPVIRATRAKYKEEGDFFGLAQCERVVAHITGAWHWYREAFLFAIVVMMVAIAAWDRLAFGIAGLVHRALAGVPIEQIRALLPDALLLLFVIVSEIWNFLLRADTWVTLRAIRSLETRYSLAPKS
jgi:hypothetical protein